MLLQNDTLRKEPVLHADETTLQVLKEPGCSSASKSYMWLYRTSGCAQQKSGPRRGLPARIRWLVHADGYQGYHKLPEKMQKDAPAAIDECYCSRLFKMEQAFAELTPEER